MSNNANINSVSSAALAYLGDCVMEMCVRVALVELGLSSSRHLNTAALDFVRASAQAEAAGKIIPALTDEEEAIFRRGRNVGHTNVPKSATVSEYRRATGLEALFGYLKLCGKEERINELFFLGYSEKINSIKENPPKA